MSDHRISRPIVLANGARVPLDVAATNLALITSYLADPDSEWDIVNYLREVCLGRPIEPEQTLALVREQLLSPDGSVDSAMQAVVLSSVRGEGRLLHLVSPFTDPLDRAVAEFLMARDYIRSYLSPGEAKSVLEDDSVEKGLGLLRRARKWTDREADRTSPPPDDLPPH
jgi:hypothetical protein